MKQYKVKFFGSKKERSQIRLEKLSIETSTMDNVEDILRHKFGFKVINGLKIKEVNENE